MTGIDETKTKVTGFPRGFIIGGDEASVPEHFVKGPLISGFYLDPLNSLDHAYSAEFELGVVVVGTCRKLDDPGTSPAYHLLQARKHSRNQFKEMLRPLVGRFVVFLVEGTSVLVFGDATCMRPVFYSSNGGILASHASLVVKASGKVHRRVNLKFSSSFPANFTPFEGVKILVPNFYLELDNGTITRYRPTGPNGRSSVESAARELLEKSVASFRALAGSCDSRLAMTAGLDSRVSLAVALAADLKPGLFTYGGGSKTRVDRETAGILAHNYGFEHAEVPTHGPSKSLRELLKGIHYLNHHRGAIEPLRHWINDQRMPVFTTNVLEIGQSNYRKLEWLWGCKEPTTARAMSEVYFRKLAWRIRERTEKDSYIETIEPYFQSFIDETGGFVGDRLDPFDEYYWLFRMGTWHGAATVEKDFYGEPLNFFNSQSIIDTILSVPQLDQYDCSVFYRLITMVDSSLLDVPINPHKRTVIAPR